MELPAAYHAPICLSCASPMARCSSYALPSAHNTLQKPSISSSLLLPCSRERCRRIAPPGHRPLSSPLRWRGGRGERTEKVRCMYSGTATAVTAATWKISVLNSELPVLVEFFASWCGPCRMVDRLIDEIAEEYAGRLKCFKLNADHYPQIAIDHGVERVPTILIFYNGEQLESITGTMPKSVYVRAIEKTLA